MYKRDEEKLEMGEEEGLERQIVALLQKLEWLRRETRAGGDDEGEAMAALQPARLELRSMALWRAVVAECAASLLYVVVVCGAAASAGVGASASAVLLATALASGCAVATLALCFHQVSGAHVSPAVSVALCVRRRLSPLRTGLYVAAQCGGAIAGAALLYGLAMPGQASVIGGAGAGGGGGGGAAWQRLATEALLTALVVGAHFAAVAGGGGGGGGAAPLLRGLAYTTATFVSMPYLNPARALGPAFVLGKWEQHWVQWLGPLAGAVLCALLLEWTGRRKRAPPSAPSDHSDDLDKDAFPLATHAPSYCAPVDRPEPLYGGTKSLYCRSPPPARHPLHRSQSVYSKGSCAGGPLVVRAAGSALAHSQNAHNATREPAYGAVVVRQGPAGAAAQERRESVYGGAEGVRRPPLPLLHPGEAYGAYGRAPPPPLPLHRSLADHY